MTIEECKQKILEITKSHQKIDTHYGIIYALLDPLTNQEQSTLPSEIVQARKIFNQILESVPEQQYQFILDELDKNFYHHNGNLLLAPFVKFVLETSKKQIDGVDTFLDSSNLKQLRSIYRKFKGEEDSRSEDSKNLESTNENTNNTQLKTSETISNTKDSKNSESIDENTEDMHSKTSETISNTKDSKNSESIDENTEDMHSKTSETISNTKDSKNLTGDQQSSETIEYEKELSPEAIANAEKLRRRGLQLFSNLIDDMMNTPLDPAIQKIMDTKDDLPINNIRETPTTETKSVSVQLKKKDKKTNWTIFGMIALSGVAGLALAHFLHSRNASPSHLIQANVGSTPSEKIPIQIVKSTSTEEKVNGHQKILTQYEDLDSLASAVMNILEDKSDITTPRKPSRDKYADIPSAKELFGKGE